MVSIDPIEVEAVRSVPLRVETWLAVYALMTAARELVAIPTRESVLAFTAEVTPAVWEFVFAFTSATTDDDAASISLCVARLPSPRIAATTSETSVPNDVSEREP